MENLPKSAAIKYAYTYVLSLDGSGQTRRALQTLKGLIINYRDKSTLSELGLYLSQKVKSKTDYDWFIKLSSGDS
jgi:hypothetical protein